MIVHKLNESYSYLDGELEQLQKMYHFLKVEKPGAYFDPLVKSGFKSPYVHFSSVQNKKLLVANGHLQILKNFGVQSLDEQSDYGEFELDKYLGSLNLPFKPHDFQIKAFKESLLNVKQINKMATGSGKSLTISMIADFFRQKGKRGVLLVPNINLLTQFHNDILEYGLEELWNDTHIIGGGQNKKHFDNALTISTWQSLQNWHDELDKLDFVITDEAHRFASDETAAIVKGTVNCRYKFGFTGTIPEDPVSKMELIGLFGLPKTYITARELIDRGLATPVKINSIIFKYSDMDRKILREAGGFSQQLKFIKEHEMRNKFIVNLTCKLKSGGNTLVLFQHTEHGKTLFIDTMKELFPDVEVANKDITGKKSFEFQERFGVFFLNGEDDVKTREKTRKILEKYADAILIANYALLSTGVNIKRLFNMVLASPLRSYTTVTQSIGRLMRLYPGKLEANVYDLVDDMGIRKEGGTFYKQYTHRKNVSYNSEEYPVIEREFNLGAR